MQSGETGFAKDVRDSELGRAISRDPNRDRTNESTFPVEKR